MQIVSGRRSGSGASRVDPQVRADDIIMMFRADVASLFWWYVAEAVGPSVWNACGAWRHIDLDTRNVVSAWYHVASPFTSILVVVIRSAVNLQIGGVTIVNRSLVAVDPRLDVVAARVVRGRDFEALCHAWRRVETQNMIEKLGFFRSWDQRLWQKVRKWLDQDCSWEL